MEKQEKNEPQANTLKEPFVRAHKLTLVQITIATLSLIFTVGGFTAAWLKFPSVAQFFNLENLTSDSKSNQPETNSNTESSFIDSEFPKLRNDTVIKNFSSDCPKSHDFI